MRTRIDGIVLLAGSAAADLAFRVAQVALPLVVLTGTGSVAATGLVAGAEGIPVLLSPWWARRARQWLDSGRRLAGIAVFDTVALALVPAAAAAGVLNVPTLVVAGLLLGVGEALSTPGRAALLADVGDRLGPDGAVALLTWQDGLRRAGMIAGPPLGALAVAAGWALPMLWLQAGVVLLSGLLAWPVAGEPTVRDLPAPSIWSAVSARPEVLRGWVIRGTGCLTWFAFTLGLSVIGAECGRPGVYLAAGMTGYGLGAVLGTTLAVAAVRRVSPRATAGAAWTVVGLGWLAMGVWTTPFAIALIAAVAGVAVVLGIAAISAIITRSSAGAERRALLSGQSVVVTASSAAGMLFGGPLIGALGAERTLRLTGVLTAAAALAATIGRPRRGSVTGAVQEPSRYVVMGPREDDDEADAIGRTARTAARHRSRAGGDPGLPRGDDRPGRTRGGRDPDADLHAVR